MSRAPELTQKTTGAGRVEPNRTAVGTGLVPEIDAVFEKKDHPHIAVIQGSFDYLHEGHLDLFEAVANSQLPPGPGQKADAPDLVLIVPSRPYGYTKKPYLHATFERRIEDTDAGIRSRPGLGRKVKTSNVADRITGKPGALVKQLVEAYPGATFSYCLGFDSFDESAQWAGLEKGSEHGRLKLIAVKRGGYELHTPERADAVLQSQGTVISSSEIREALDSRDLRRIKGRVPPSTLARLESEIQQRTQTERAGEALLGLDKPSRLAFETLRDATPKDSINLLQFVEERDVSEPVRQHLANVQTMINRFTSELRNVKFRVSREQLDKGAGVRDKVIYDGVAGMHLQGRFLHKETSPERARKIEFLTVLANLFRMPTSLALVHKDNLPDKSGAGVTTKLIEDVESTPELYDNLSRFDQKVFEYLLVSRWFNEVVHNLDCWWGQFLVPKKAPDRNLQVVNIDLDDAFEMKPRELAHSMLTGIGRPTGGLSVDHTVFTKHELDFRFDRPVGFSKGHFDCEYEVFGYVLRDYVTGKIDIDLDRVKEQIRFANEIPRSVIQNAMEKWFEASAEAHKDESGEWFVQIPAAKDDPSATEDGRIARADFERLFIKRIEDSVEQYTSFLDDVKAARNNPSSELYQYWSALPERVF